MDWNKIMEKRDLDSFMLALHKQFKKSYWAAQKEMDLAEYANLRVKRFFYKAPKVKLDF